MIRWWYIILLIHTGESTYKPVGWQDDVDGDDNDDEVVRLREAFVMSYVASLVEYIFDIWLPHQQTGTQATRPTATVCVLYLNDKVW